MTQLRLVCVKPIWQTHRDMLVELEKRVKEYWGKSKEVPREKRGIILLVYISVHSRRYSQPRASVALLYPAPTLNIYLLYTTIFES